MLYLIISVVGEIYCSTKATDQDWIHKSRVPTDHFQRSLPHLPIPKLEETCERYLKAQLPIQSAEEHNVTASAVKNFLAGDGQCRYSVALL